MTPREGTIVADRYRLVRKVGGGPVAAIWQVVDEVNDTLGAVKLLSPAMHSHAEALTRFSLEERISRELQGPYFAERLGSGSWNSMRYLAWKWHEGESLRSLIDRTERLDAPTVHSVVQEACAALALTHERGYAHADIKPENLFFADGEPGAARQLKLFGFGIAARAPAAKSAQTAKGRRRPGQVLGTPLYMCPESVMGYLPGDARADLWALATVAYEALTGRPPFLGSNESEVFRAILDRNAPAPSSLAPLPDTVDTWWEQVMSGEFQTTEQLATQLSDALRSALRSSHTQRSASGLAAGFVSPRIEIPQVSLDRPVEGPETTPQVAVSQAASLSVAHNFSQTVSGAGEGNPLATALLAMRNQGQRNQVQLNQKTGNTKSGDTKPGASGPAARQDREDLPSASREKPTQPMLAPDPPFTPLVPTPDNFRMDARKTLVGLTPLLLTPTGTNRADTEAGGPELHGGRPVAAQGIQPQEAIEIAASPTVPFPLSGLAPEHSHPANSEFQLSEQAHFENPNQGRQSASAEPTGPATVVMQRPGWLEPVGLGRVTESRTFQQLVPSRDRRAQLVAAVVVCSAAALLMAIISLASGTNHDDLERANLAAQPKKGKEAEDSSLEKAKPVADSPPTSRSTPGISLADPLTPPDLKPAKATPSVAVVNPKGSAAVESSGRALPPRAIPDTDKASPAPPLEKPQELLQPPPATRPKRRASPPKVSPGDFDFGI